jgi:hypothetical protein
MRFAPLLGRFLTHVVRCPPLSLPSRPLGLLLRHHFTRGCEGIQLGGVNPNDADAIQVMASRHSNLVPHEDVLEGALRPKQVSSQKVTQCAFKARLTAGMLKRYGAACGFQCRGSGPC